MIEGRKVTCAHIVGAERRIDKVSKACDINRGETCIINAILKASVDYQAACCGEGLCFQDILKMHTHEHVKDLRNMLNSLVDPLYPEHITHNKTDYAIKQPKMRTNQIE